MQALRISAVLLLLLSLTTCTKDEPDTGNILVEVTNPEGWVGGAVVRTQPATTSANSNANGSAFLSNIPPGDYLVMAVHPELGTADTIVTVNGNRTTEVSLFLTATIGQPPTIFIQLPDRNFPAEEFVGRDVNFLALVTDPNGPETTEVVWESSLDGIIHRQKPTAFGEARFSTRQLSAGTHRIYATAIDPLGWTVVDSTSITLLPAPRAVVLQSVDPTAEGPRLTWSAYDQEGFFYYSVSRQLLGAEAEPQFIHSSDQPLNTTFVDHSLPYGADARYWVEVRTDYGITTRSNALDYAATEQAIALDGPVIDLIAHPTRRELYLLSQERSQVDVVDLNTQAIVATVPVRSLPNDFALDAAGQYLYVAGGGSSFIDVIDVSARQVVRSINTALWRNTIGSYQLTIGTIGSDYLVLAGIQGQNGLALLDTQTGAVLSSINDGLDHIALAVHPEQQKVYVSSGYGQKALRAYTVVNQTLTLAASSDSFIYGGGTRMFLSTDGGSLFYNDRQYDSEQLSTVLGTYNRQLLATNQNGTLVFSAEGAFSTQTFNVVYTFRQPLFGSMYYDHLTDQLYVAHQLGNTSRIQLTILPL